jgi:hypothetical protein
MSNRFLCLLLAAIVPAASAWAAEGAGSEPAQDHARLERKAALVESRLHGKTGALERVELKRQQREIDGLIRRIEAGENVSPSEVDQIVGQIPVRRPAVGKR